MVLTDFIRLRPIEVSHDFMHQFFSLRVIVFNESPEVVEFQIGQVFFVWNIAIGYGEPHNIMDYP